MEELARLAQRKGHRSVSTRVTHTGRADGAAECVFAGVTGSADRVFHSSRVVGVNRSGLCFRNKRINSVPTLKEKEGKRKMGRGRSYQLPIYSI